MNLKRSRLPDSHRFATGGESNSIGSPSFVFRSGLSSNCAATRIKPAEEFPTLTSPSPRRSVIRAQREVFDVWQSWRPGASGYFSHCLDRLRSEQTSRTRQVAWRSHQGI